MNWIWNSQGHLENATDRQSVEANIKTLLLSGVDLENLLYGMRTLTQRQEASENLKIHLQTHEKRAEILNVNCDRLFGISNRQASLKIEVTYQLLEDGLPKTLIFEESLDA